MFDLLIRGGTVVDGTGRTGFGADVAVVDGLIAAVGPDLDGEAAEVIDATGLTVTPGFVDVHTHYDGQITWDPQLEPSSAHGVTTVLNGNCGVGFAPVRRGREPWLVQLMEGVEDIPSATLNEGIDWTWQSYPEYLDALARRRWAVDVATMVPHGAVRAYVMDERGARTEPQTDDIRDIADVVRGAIEAGAFGFSSSRVEGHKASDGLPVPGTYASAHELDAIAAAVVAGGGGLVEVAQAGISGTGGDQLDELAMLASISRRRSVPVSFLVMQNRVSPKMWTQQLDTAEAENASGAALVPQVAGRPFGMLVGFAGYHPFARRPTFRRLECSLPLPELLEELRRPAVREAILHEADGPDDGFLSPGASRTVDIIRTRLDNIYRLDRDVDYEPPADGSVAAIAAARGDDPLRTLYEWCCEQEGRNYSLLPAFNFVDHDHEVLRSMLTAPGTILGLADGGAHCRMICDASQPTTMLTHWVRDRRRGPRLDLSFVVKRLTSEPAAFLGLTDRGVIGSGMRADINIIDLAALQLHRPRPVDDLPAGGRRILQDATGYTATIVAGEITRRNGIPTGALPGRLLRRGHS